MTTPRPRCGHCGNVYGYRPTRSESYKHRPDQPPPEYRGNLIVVKETVRPSKSDWSHDLGHTNVTEMLTTRELWDGVTWHGGYRPFCTLRCALDFARKVYDTFKKGRAA